MTKWLLVPEVAEILRVGDHHVRRQIRLGELEAVNIGTKLRPTYRISDKTVEQYMQARRTGDPRRR